METPTWADHLYSCRYDYPNGNFMLSVKELAAGAQTNEYIDQLVAKLGQRYQLHDIGEGAFYTANGSVVTSKDNKILLVDISGLPDRFDDPPTPRAAVSRIIAMVIMGRWQGD